MTGLHAFLVTTTDDQVCEISDNPFDIVFAKTRGQARGVFCKLWLLPFTAKLHIRIIARDVVRHEGICAGEDDPLWEIVDPAYTARLPHWRESTFFF